MSTERRPSVKSLRLTRRPLESVEPHEEYIGKLIRSVEGLREKGLLIDAVLECEDGVRLPCHKLVLAACCGHFRQMVCESAAAKTGTAEEGAVANDQMFRIKMPPKFNGKCMQRILKFVYSGCVDMPNHADQVKELLAASHYLQLDDFNKQLASVLVRSLSVDNYTFVWDLAEEYHITDLETEVVKFVSQDLLRFMKFPEYLTFSPSRVRQLISSRCVTTTSPNKVLLGLVDWVKKDVPNREREMGALLRYVKFSKLSNPFLKTLITTEPLVSKCHTLWCFIAATLYSRGVHLSNYDPERDNITNQQQQPAPVEGTMHKSEAGGSSGDLTGSKAAGDGATTRTEINTNKINATAELSPATTCKFKLKRVTKTPTTPKMQMSALTLKTKEYINARENNMLP